MIQINRTLSCVCIGMLLSVDLHTSMILSIYLQIIYVGINNDPHYSSVN